ncbi:SRPBCC family protein [Nocardioides sp. BP30]|uniref:SRPBCC family protein n=1 Tax=Nocardioides sp. BP30 TaxID=3036374 RepID=UPI0024686BB1|nr:SRPBCC family protein [Nocardioides sp. BP30]WGL53238.1 SRPBCC family protein [Nocardioides sp. BP30]
MPVTSVTKDPTALTMTVVADFPAPVERLWDAYLDPRQLELFWGPPTYPARFTRHDAAAGGLSHYAMTGPEGEVSRGYWEWLSVEAHRGFEVLDGFALESGAPNREMPSMRMVFTFEPTDAGSRVTTTTHFNTAEELAQLVEMGMEQGMREAMGQMDRVLADLRTFAADLPTSTQVLSDTQVRISRVISGSVEAVWRAHHEPELLQRWLLGPDGWTMPVCRVADRVGESYRYEWEKGSDRFGFEGELLESVAPYRSVTSERMIGLDAPGSTNELTLTPVEGGTLLSLVITYPDAEVRDSVLATGMTDGMEASYQRLESQVLTAA